MHMQEESVIARSNKKWCNGRSQNVAPITGHQEPLIPSCTCGRGDYWRHPLTCGGLLGLIRWMFLVL